MALPRLHERLPAPKTQAPLSGENAVLPFPISTTRDTTIDWMPAKTLYIVLRYDICVISRRRHSEEEQLFGDDCGSQACMLIESDK